MTRERDGGTDLEGRLNEALLAYLDERQAGREPDREAFLAANADLRGDLALFIDCHEELARMTAPLRASPLAGAATTAAFPGANRKDSHLRDAAPRILRMWPRMSSASWAISGCCASSAAAAWASSTWPSSSRSGAASRSRSCRSPRPSMPVASNASRPRPWPPRTCSTRGSSRSTPSAASEASTTMRCSISRVRASPG